MVGNWRRWVGGIVLGMILALVIPVSAQGPYSAQIQAAIRRLLSSNQTITGTWTFSTPPIGAGSIGGSIAAGQVAVGSGVDTIGGSANFLWDDTKKRLAITDLSTPPYVFDTNAFRIYRSYTYDSAPYNALVPVHFYFSNTATGATGADFIPSFQVDTELFGGSYSGDGAITFYPSVRVSGATLVSYAEAIHPIIEIESAAQVTDAAVINAYYHSGSGSSVTNAIGVNITVNGSGVTNAYGVKVNNMSGVTATNKYAIYTGDGTVRFGDDVVLADGKALKTDTTTAHTALFQAYDANDAVYRTFGTATNGNTPSWDWSAPAGGSLTGNFTTLQVGSVSLLPALTGTTGSIGGGLLSVACTSGTATVTGATTDMGLVATPAAYPGDGVYWEAYRSNSNEVTVKVCTVAAVTPTATTYTVRAVQ